MSAALVTALSGRGKVRRFRQVIVCDGNSLTAGQGGTPYPTQLQAALPSTVLVVNTGIGGQSTPMMSSAADDVDRFAVKRRSIVIAWEVRNDLYLSAAVTPLAAVEAMREYCTARTDASFRVVVCNITECTPSAYISAQDITEANALLGTEWPSFARRLVDLHANVELQTPNDGTYNYDGVHLTTAGYEVVTNSVLEFVPSVAAMRLI